MRNPSPAMADLSDRHGAFGLWGLRWSGLGGVAHCGVMVMCGTRGRDEPRGERRDM
jgi:hypothetical protein